ncbi:MAG: flagellar hook-basal body complex protein, partial [Pseudomonadota bacterium]
MTLSSSLNAGVAGLNVNANKLGTISDNIANSQTLGYKRVDTQFSALVVSSGEGAFAAGGVRALNFREVDARGSLNTTNNVTDLAIGGRGFLPVVPVSALDNVDGDLPLQLVTTGSFRPDAEGILRNPAGLALLGWPAEPDGSIPQFPRDSADGLEPVQIQTNALAGSPTSQIELGVNLPAEQTRSGSTGNPIPLAIEYFDNVGASQSLNLQFSPTVPGTGSSNEWTVTISDTQTPAANNPVASFVVRFDDSRTAGGTIQAVPTTTGGTYDIESGIFSFNVAGGPMDMEIGRIGELTGMTQLSAEFTPTGILKNGAPVATLSTIDVDENGFIRAVFDGGFVRTLYQLPVADFPNVNGLRAIDNQAFVPSTDSGSLFLWDAGDGP